MGMMDTEPVCSTISNLVSLPSGVFKVSRLILNVRPCNKGSDLSSSKGMCFSLYEIEFVDYKTKARANSPGFCFIFFVMECSKFDQASMQRLLRCYYFVRSMRGLHHRMHRQHYKTFHQIPPLYMLQDDFSSFDCLGRESLFVAT